MASLSIKTCCKHVAKQKHTDLSTRQIISSVTLNTIDGIIKTFHRICLEKQQRICHTYSWVVCFVCMVCSICLFLGGCLVFWMLIWYLVDLVWLACSGRLCCSACSVCWICDYCWCCSIRLICFLLFNVSSLLELLNMVILLNYIKLLKLLKKIMHLVNMFIFIVCFFVIHYLVDYQIEHLQMQILKYRSHIFDVPNNTQSCYIQNNLFRYCSWCVYV